MSSKPKQKLGYFKLTPEFYRTTQFLELEYEFKDFAYRFTVEIFLKIFDRSYYMQANEYDLKAFSRERNMTYSKVVKIIRKCIEIGYFSEQMYKDHQILTSADIQEEWLRESAINKRVQLIINKPYFLHQESYISAIIRDRYIITNEVRKGNRGSLYVVAQPREVGGQHELSMTVGDVKPSKPIAPVIPAVQPVPAQASPRPVKVSEKTPAEISYDQVKLIIDKPYAEHTDKFREMHPEDWYNSYKIVNEEIDKKYKPIRESKNQLMLHEYKDLYKEFRFKMPELYLVMGLIVANGIEQKTSIYHRLHQFLTTQKEKKERATANNIPKPQVHFNTVQIPK